MIKLNREVVKELYKLKYRIQLGIMRKLLIGFVVYDRMILLRNVTE